MRAKYVLLPRVRRSARNPSKKIGLKRVPKEILNAMAKFRRVSPKIRTNLVGGAVVDLLLGRTPKDWDIEVFGVTPDQLAHLASQLGHSKEVGKAFGIVKVVLPSGLDLDLSVPRTDNKTGAGHKGFTPTFDPNMTNKEAARRRDFTINALALDLSNGLLIDPYGGLSDLKRGIIRATDPKLFAQDPLRGLRAMQLLARKAKTVHPDTMRLIRLMRPEFRQLPKERLLEEWRKLLLKSKKPSVGLQFLQDSRWIENFPELAVLESVPQHPEWHPEGNVWEHTKLATDAAAALRPYIREKYREPYMFATMLHDVGKAVPGITVYPEDIEDGRYPPERLYTAHGHDSAGRQRARDFMESIGASKKDTRLVEELVVQHMQPHGLTAKIGEGKGAGKAAWGRLARKLAEGGGDLRLLGRISQADAAGSRQPGVRTFTEGVPDWEHVPSRESFRWHEDFEKEASATKPMVQGRDFMALGYRPGPQIGIMLRLALKLQDEGMERDEIMSVVQDAYPMKTKKNRRRNPAYPAMLANDWKKRGEPDPTGWWASEKYDGIRALWDGENFYSRNGNIFHAPQWFKDTLPNTPLDGELWQERSVAGFQKAVGAVRKKVGGRDWENITYMVFDIPTSKEPFEKVQAKLKRMNLGRYAEVAHQHKVRSRADMLKRYEAAIAEGAEGLMLRQPGSRYVPARSMALLKVKPEYDAEAVVTGYKPGTGKHKGRMGAIYVHLLGDKSKEFKIGTGFSDRERESPPPIGSIVEFKFSDKTARGIPRHPRFHRIRTDMMADKPKRKRRGKPAFGLVGSPFDMVSAPGTEARSEVRRKAVIVRSGAGKNIAFYRSTGTGTPGMVEQGEWVPFGGLTRLHGNLWVIKAKGAKIPAGKMRDISNWLSGQRLRKSTRDFDIEDVRGINAHLANQDALCDPSRPTFLCKLPQKPKPKRKALEPAWKKAMAKRKPAPKPKRKAPAKVKRSAKATLSAREYFNMGSKELVALGDAGAIKELKRRGRNAKGKKVG